MARPDVLLVSLGTTLGWRVADEQLLAQLERAGAATPPCPWAGAPPTACGAATRSTTWSRCTPRAAPCAAPSSVTSRAR